MGRAKPSNEKFFHLQTNIFGYGKGDSVEQKAAYRMGERLVDEETNITYNYTRKKKQENIETIMRLPYEAKGKRLEDPLAFVKAVKEAELNSRQRKNSQFYREFEIVLYQELTDEQNKELASRFAEKLTARGMCCMMSFHKLSSDNPHCHILTAMRHLDESGEAFKLTKAREWNDRKLTEKVREEYETIINDYFKELDIDLTVSAKSYAERGIDREAQLHVPLDSKGIEKADAVRLENKEIKKRNKQREVLEKMETALSVQEKKLEHNMLDREMRMNTREFVETKNKLADKQIAVLDKKEVIDVKSGEAKTDSNSTLISLDNLANSGTNNTVKSSDKQVQKGVLLSDLIHTFSKRTISKKASQYVRYPTIARAIKRKEVLDMAERKLGPQSGEAATESIEKDVKQVTSATLNKTAEVAQNITRTLAEASLKTLRRQRRISKLVRDRYTESKKYSNTLSHDFREKRNLFETNANKHASRIKDLKLQNKSLKNSIRSEKIFSITGLKNRREMRSQIRDNKIKIEANKAAVAREKRVTKTLKKQVKRAKKEELKNKFKMAVSYLKERKAEKNMQQFAGIELGNNQRIVSKEQQQAEHKKRVQEAELKEFNELNNIPSGLQTTVENLNDLKKTRTKEQTEESRRQKKSEADKSVESTNDVKKEATKKEEKKKESVLDEKKEQRQEAKKDKVLDEKKEKAFEIAEASKKIEFGKDALEILKANKEQMQQKTQTKSNEIKM